MPECIHVHPIDDLKEHVLEGPGCWCEPRIEEQPSGTIVIHNALDGREKEEERRGHN